MIFNHSAKGMKKTEIATIYQISRATVYRVIKEGSWFSRSF